MSAGTSGAGALISTVSSSDISSSSASSSLAKFEPVAIKTASSVGSPLKAFSAAVLTTPASIFLDLIACSILSVVSSLTLLAYNFFNPTSELPVSTS